MRDLHLGRLRKIPADAPVGFIRKAWPRGIGPDIPDRRTHELCVLVELRDRLRAGDMWVEGSRRYRAVEQQLISGPVFATMRAAGPLPIPAPDTAGVWLAERRARLARRLAEVERKAETDALEDVQLSLGRMLLANLGRRVPQDLLQHLSPLGWQHINLTGDYLCTDPDAPSTALRPLRQMRAVEGPAKP